MKRASIAILVSLLGCNDATTETSSVVANVARDSTCASCHAEEAAAWRGSHHDRAMDLATEETVLGDFADTTLEHATGTALFFRKEDAFWIRTTGANGADEDFRVLYVFGVDPLQQYLVQFPGGAVQCCDLAWDTDEKRWFDLTPEEPNGAADPLHWTGSYQRWNSMCAECHSTDLVKAFDPVSGKYDTHYSEIDVGCTACHGDGAKHVAWAEDGASGSEANAGFERPLKRGVIADQVEACAACHSRRTTIADLDAGGSFFDRYEPATLRPGLYHADGQILDEVYVYGSYAQSKMFAKGVACTECHDAHSAELVLEGNALCMQCHTSLAPVERFPTLQKKDYDTPEHHHHEQGSTGAQCIACHMPERTYMQIDERHDHSLRVPRPDISIDLGTPNACNDCHDDQTPKWAADHVANWFGPREDEKPHFGYIFEAARLGDPSAFPWLMDLTQDMEQPPIVRATGLEVLESFGPAGAEAIEASLTDEDPFVRFVAARSMGSLPLQQRVGPLLPLLEDSVRVVRMHAARSLAELRVQSIVPERETKLMNKGIAEFQAAQNYSADLPGAHLNLGLLHEDSGDRIAALAAYRYALEIDPWFLQAAFNLTSLLNRMNRNSEAETVLRDALKLFPEEGELHYSLGLLLAELDRMEDSLVALTEAGRWIPSNPRIHYNRGLVLQKLGKLNEAENALLSAYALTPVNPQLVHALVLLYQEQGDLAAAKRFATELLALRPEEPIYQELLQGIEELARR